MYQNRPKRFRRRSNGRSHGPRDNGGMQTRLRSNSFSNSQTRNHFRTPQSAEKLFEKYNTLAKEALTSGDKTLSENYFQHADHFMRIIENKNINQNQNRIQADDKPTEEDKHLVKNSNVNQNTTIEKKEEKKE